MSGMDQAADWTCGKFLNNCIKYACTLYWLHINPTFLQIAVKC